MKAQAELSKDTAPRLLMGTLGPMQSFENPVVLQGG